MLRRERKGDLMEGNKGGERKGKMADVKEGKGRRKE